MSLQVKNTLGRPAVEALTVDFPFARSVIVVRNAVPSPPTTVRHNGINLYQGLLGLGRDP